MEMLQFKIILNSPAFISGCMEENSGVLYKEKEKTIEPKHRIIGSDGDSLRPSSLKGILRFWYRAKQIGLDIEDLRQKEALLFGSTNTGQGIRLVLRNQTEWTPQKIGGDGTVKPGSSLSYLGYGPLNYNKIIKEVSSHYKGIHRDAIPEKNEFEYIASGTKEQLDELEKILLLLHLFGGIGTRSRRAWGSVSIKGDFIPAMQPSETIIDWIQNCLQIVWKNDLKKPSDYTNLPDYSAFSKHTKIKLSNSSLKDYKDIMNVFFEQFKKTRTWNNNNPSASPQIAIHDHNVEENDARNHSLTCLPLRLAYGLPYQPQSFRNGWKIVYKGLLPDPKNPHKKIVIERRSSPLFLKVLKGPDDNYYAISLFLKSKFFGNIQTNVGTSDQNKVLPMQNWSAIESYLNNSAWSTVDLP